MNFSYGIIAIVGVLAAISIGFIAADPGYLVDEASVTSHIMPQTAIMGKELLVEVEFRDTNNDIVDHVNYDITATQYGNTILSEPNSHRHLGMHPIHTTEMIGESQIDIEVIIQGLGHGDEITPPMGVVNMIRVVPEAPSITPHIIPQTAIVGEPLLVEVEFRDDNDNLVDYVNYSIIITQEGDPILIEPDSQRRPDMHPIYETAALSDAPVDIMVALQGLGPDEMFVPLDGVGDTMSIIPEPTPEMEMETEMEPEPESLPMTATISIPEGAGIPGCENTDECYLPYEITVDAGTTVSWHNDDAAAHTVTSGVVVKGPDDLFDSRLFMSGSDFEFTFTDAGTYDYYCMVHTWMVGIVNVN